MNLIYNQEMPLDRYAVSEAFPGSRQRILIHVCQAHNTGLEIVDRGRWFYAVYRSEKGNRNIAFRADFDAIAMEEPDTLEYSSKNPAFAIAKVIDAIPELISTERNSWK